MSDVTRRELAALFGVSALALSVPTMVLTSPAAEAAAKTKKAKKKKKGKKGSPKAAENETTEVATADEAANN